MIEVLLLVAAAALVAACGLFVAAEFALITVDRAAVERAAEDPDDAGARGVLAALRSLSTQLSAAQLGITLTNLLIGFLAEPAIADLVRGPLEDVGVPDGAVSTVALVLALTLATAVTMVLGELVPKNLALARPLATARAVQRLQRGFTSAAGPVLRVPNGLADAMLRRLGVEPSEELASARSPQELVSLVDRSAREGTLPATTAALVERTLTLGTRRAADVMVPRERMVTVDDQTTVDLLLQRVRRSGRSRLPVLTGAGEVVGVAHLKDLIRVAPADRAQTTAREVARQAVLVPSSVEADRLLDDLRRGGSPLALVVNEFGGLDGMVALEDLLEELVGDVRDEHDRLDDAFELRPDGAWSVSGLLRPDELAARTGLAVPEGVYDTLGGLVAERLGRLAQVGDEVVVDGVRLRVERLDGLRADRLVVGPEASA